MASAAVSSSGAPCPSALPEAFGSYLQVGPDAGMVGRPQRRIVRARPIETDLAGEDFDAFGNPDVIDGEVAARHPDAAVICATAFEWRAERGAENAPTPRDRVTGICKRLPNMA